MKKHLHNKHDILKPNQISWYCICKFYGRPQQILHQGLDIIFDLLGHNSFSDLTQVAGGGAGGGVLWCPTCRDKIYQHM